MFALEGSPADRPGIFIFGGAMYCIILLFLILTFPITVWSQTDEDEESSVEETVIVTADRLEEELKDAGSSVTVITREEIEQQKALFVLDVLRSVPGIYISQSGSVGKVTTIFSRGAESDHILVLLDGVQINDSLNFVDLSTLSTNNIERIEIVRGPQGTLYGSDAMGGVINIISRKGGKILSGVLEGGSDATFNGAVRTGAGSERNNFALEYSLFDTDGETLNDDYQNQTLAFQGHVRVTEWTDLGVLYRNYDTETGIPLNAGVPAPDRRQDTHAALLNIPIKQEIRDGWTAEVNFSDFNQEIDFNDPDDPFGFTFSNSESNTRTFQVMNTIAFKGEQTLIGGYEFERVRVSDISSFGVSLDNAKITNHAFFGQYQTVLRDTATVTVGIRIDDHSEFGTKTNPRLAVSYRLPNDIRFHGTLATGYRAPRPAELSGPFGNPDLQPEEVTGVDLGVEKEFLSGKVFLSGTGFFNDFKQMIDFPPPTFRPENIQEVQTSGFEFALGVRPYKNLQIKGGYTFLHTEDRRNGEQLLRRPKHSGSIYVVYRWQRIGANFNWQLIGDRFDIHDVTFVRVVSPAFNKADLVLNFDVTKSLQLYMRITNVFDKRYQEVFGFPSPDRSVFGGIRFNH